jgi:hypothetical protein
VQEDVRFRVTHEFRKLERSFEDDVHAAGRETYVASYQDMSNCFGIRIASQSK